MIEHNPMDYNATVAELRELREQRERLYYRDESLNRPDETVVKPKKQLISLPTSDTDSTMIGIQHLNQCAINCYKDKPSTDDNGCACFVIGIIVGIFVIQLLASTF